jgi:hypothetical protein
MAATTHHKQEPAFYPINHASHPQCATEGLCRWRHEPIIDNDAVNAFQDTFGSSNKAWLAHRRQVDDDASALELGAHNNNNMLPLANAFLICMLTSILSTSGEQLPKVLAAATSMPPSRAAEQLTRKLPPYVPLQIQLHQAKVSATAPTSAQLIIDVVGMLSHPSFFCFCWHHTGDVCDVHNHQHKSR